MKAILVIDMPKSCGQCPCVSFKTDKFECQWRYIDNPDIVQEWCPLKPIHALKSSGKDYIIYERQYLYENLEREYELMKEAREFDESNISN